MGVLRDDGRVMPLLPVTSQEGMWGEMGHTGCGDHNPPSHLCCPTGSLCHARMGSLWLEVLNLVMMSYLLMLINPWSSETHLVLLIDAFV